jgi:hypothetical protein
LKSWEKQIIREIYNMNSKTWKYAMLSAVSFSTGLLAACLYEPGPIRSFLRDAAPSAGRGGSNFTEAKGAPAGAADGKTIHAQPPRDLTKEESVAIAESLSPEETRELVTEWRKIQSEPYENPRASEGIMLNLYEEHGRHLDLFLRYNQVPDGIRKNILTILTNSNFEISKSLFAPPKAGWEEKPAGAGVSALVQRIQEKRRAELLRLVDEGMFEKIITMSDRRSIIPEVFQAWRTGDQFAAYMREHSAPLGTEQMNALVDVLAGADAGPADDSVRQAISALLAPEQRKQFENYRREETLLAETKAADAEAERKIDALPPVANIK